MLQASAQAANEVECTALSRVEIVPSEISGKFDQSALINPYLGLCLDGDLMRILLSAISNDLIARGYVTTRPYLLEQDISDGQVEIRILAGKIESIVDAESGVANGKIMTAFMFSDEILNLRDLETSLEAIERPDSVSASFEIRPGTQPGGSIVAIRTEASNPLRTELGVIAQTELDTQLSFQAILDNPFNINDILEFRYNSGETLEVYQGSRGRELIYSFPLGSYLFAFNHSDIRYDQRVQGINGSFISEGEAVSDELRVSKIVNRSQSGKLALAFALELKDSSNFLDRERIDVSSYKTSQLSLELIHDWFQPWGQLSTSYRYQRGLDSFGARDDDYFTIEDGFDTQARLQFEKLNIDSQMYYYLTDPAWYASFGLHLQHSDDILYDNDKLFVGSPYTVRGYSSALSGSNAWYLRSDLTKRLDSAVNPISGKSFTKSILLSAGIDYGDVKCEFDNRDVCGEIYGVGLGVELADANFTGRLFWGHPLKQIGDDIGDQDIYLLDFRWTL